MSDPSAVGEPPQTTVNDQQSSAKEEKSKPGEEPLIYFRDVSHAIEFACWVVVALAPFLRWANGPAVTHDQFVIQLALVSLALSGAVGLRFYNWRRANDVKHLAASNANSIKKCL